MDGFLLFFWLKRITRLFNDVDDVVGWLTYTYNFIFKKTDATPSRPSHLELEKLLMIIIRSFVCETQNIGNLLVDAQDLEVKICRRHFWQESNFVYHSLLHSVP